MKSAAASLPQLLAWQIRRARRRYRERLDCCRRNFSEPAVHELRIATRRLLAVVNLLQALRTGRRLARVRRLLKQRLETFGPLRDLQVQQQLLAPLARRSAAARSLSEWLQRRERKCAARLRRGVKTLRAGRVNRALKSAEQELAGAGTLETADFPVHLMRVLRHDFARVARYQRALRADRPATIHRLRIAFKQYRYLCELLQPVTNLVGVPDPMEMPQFQGRMGAIQDCEVMLAALDEIEATEALTPVAIASLRRRFLSQRSRAIKSFLDNAGQMRNFRPENPMKSPRP
jgi:CHAD domain-containing protein